MLNGIKWYKEKTELNNSMIFIACRLINKWFLVYCYLRGGGAKSCYQLIDLYLTTGLDSDEEEEDNLHSSENGDEEESEDENEDDEDDSDESFNRKEKVKPSVEAVIPQEESSSCLSKDDEVKTDKVS